eukprot:CAMPEP_0176242540 /NCGR_PEP_ID=MMETSP0121_2-20121125/30456_1 /TAXON_ID=160619 /ORGANISM="Kryptoperidinium foliaceum, Strain CCMP 1326" /LENGTH=43 /DNA_ID= /DNA_START= /DNA_END= /DNA_ORIENTATION=
MSQKSSSSRRELAPPPAERIISEGTFGISSPNSPSKASKSACA